MSKRVIPQSRPAINHVLVVDDIETNLMFAEYLLNKVNPSGDVTCVLGGLEAIELLKKDPYCFSMILLDIEMPDINGITPCSCPVCVFWFLTYSLYTRD